MTIKPFRKTFVSRKNKGNYHLGDQQLPEPTSMKNLEVSFDCKLNFTGHIGEILFKDKLIYLLMIFILLEQIN